MATKSARRAEVLGIASGIGIRAVVREVAQVKVHDELAPVKPKLGTESA
jgi:hypothetical protein